MSQLAQQAQALHQQGRLAEAEALYRRILADDPSLFGAPYCLGILCHQQGRLAEAADFFTAALRLRPDETAALIYHGVTLCLADRPVEALTSLDRALVLQPGNVLALFHRAMSLSDLGRTGEAVECYDDLLARAPGHVEALNNRGLLAWQRRDAQAALADFTRALAADPRHVPSLTNRALVLGETQRAAEALADYDRLLALMPDDAELWNRRGAMLQALGRSAEALESFDRALRLRPDFATALNNRGFLRWTAQLRYDEAKADLTRALALEPDMPYLQGELLYLKMQGAEWDGYDAARAQLAQGIAAGKNVIRPFAWQAISDDPASLQQCSRLFAASHAAAVPARSAAISTGRIRIGYVSADFRDQATSHLMAGVYDAHDRTRFDVIALDNGHDDHSPMRARLERAFSQMMDIASLSDAQAAQAVRAAGIDILVNLNGYFGKPRTGLFALRPAPVQVNYLGFPATLGAPFMDYIIADRIVIPEGEQRFYDEAVVWLPHSYQANDRQRPRPGPCSRAEAGLPENKFVFCNFNQTYKLTPDIFALWMRILRRRDDSLLWLLRDNDVAPANLRRLAGQQGVAPERLIFAEPLSLEKHLARLAQADLFLDMLPYNAHTTASDALWSGVPLLTCRGSAFAGRVAASLLHAAGLPELVCENLDDYENLAVTLAQDAARLAALRTRLADNRLACALFDTARFTRHLESAYAGMMQASRAGLAPQGFSVAAEMGT